MAQIAVMHRENKLPAKRRLLMSSRMLSLSLPEMLKKISRACARTEIRDRVQIQIGNRRILLTTRLQQAVMIQTSETS